LTLTGDCALIDTSANEPIQPTRTENDMAKAKNSLEITFTAEKDTKSFRRFTIGGLDVLGAGSNGTVYVPLSEVGDVQGFTVTGTLAPIKD